MDLTILLTPAALGELTDTERKRCGGLAGARAVK